MSSRLLYSHLFQRLNTILLNLLMDALEANLVHIGAFFVVFMVYAVLQNFGLINYLPI
jgi:hypothetical protein